MICTRCAACTGYGRLPQPAVRLRLRRVGLRALRHVPRLLRLGPGLPRTSTVSSVAVATGDSPSPSQPSARPLLGRSQQRLIGCWARIGTVLSPTGAKPRNPSITTPR